ncbi:MAG: response regulator, partial [Thermodesulfobacteriota bacterium]
MSINVLLVDDNLDSITLVERQLRKAGDYRVDSIGSGTKCLEMLEQKHYDILLLDYKLPDMNGLEVLGSIVKEKYDLPVVMITGQGDEEIAVSALKKGAYEYVVKSGDFLRNIPSLINRVIEKHTMIKKKEELEKDLAKSEERYRTLVTSAMDGVISVDPRMKVTLWNPAAERIFGYTEEEMLGQNLMKIFP